MVACNHSLSHIYYRNSTLSLYGKWKDLELIFHATSAIHRVLYFNKCGWRGCRSRFVCVNEKYTTTVKGVTSDFVKMTGLKCCVWKYSICDQNALFHCIPKQVEKRISCFFVSIKSL